MQKSVSVLVMLGLVLGLLVVPAVASTAIYTVSLDFSADSQLIGLQSLNGLPLSRQNFTGDADDYPTNVTDGILTPFGNYSSGGLGTAVQQGQGVQLVIGNAGGPAIQSLTISFQLWIINTWDGATSNPSLGPDFFQVGLGTSIGACGNTGGQTTIFCETFAMSPGTAPNPLLQSYTGTPTYYGYDDPALNQQQGGNPNGFLPAIAKSGYAVYDITLTAVPVPSPGSQVTVFFRGLQNQDGLDESWTLSSLNIQAFGDDGRPGDPTGGEIPEPSTLALGGLGLGFLILANRRRKAA